MTIGDSCISKDFSVQYWDVSSSRIWDLFSKYSGLVKWTGLNLFQMATNPNDDQDAILKKAYEDLKSERNMVNNMDEKNKKATDKDVEDIQ